MSHLERIAIAPPAESGTASAWPPLSESARLFVENCAALQAWHWPMDGVAIGQIRELGQRELLAAACQYSSRYRDVRYPTQPTGIILSGHQPELFHPGVWYKNFVLSEFARQQNAVAINLVVDNDLDEELDQVVVPVESSSDHWVRQTVAIDSSAPRLPIELRTINDLALVRRFPMRLAERLPTVANPLVYPMWEPLDDVIDPQLRLGATLAALRHRLESRWRLETAEVPLSTVAQSRSFSHFVAEILARLPQFHELHNRALAQYRAAHRIRSRARPVPELEASDEWLEAPFWIWQVEHPLRRPLWARVTNNRIELTDQAAWTIALDSSDLASQIQSLSNQGIAIRPRAITTTLFARTVLCTTFIHGLGGAKYDELTDQIMGQFWQIPPPRFLVATATWHLPLAVPLVSSDRVANCQQRLRKLNFQPELFLQSADRTKSDTRLSQLVNDKIRLLQQQPGTGSRKTWQQQLETLNRQLSVYLSDEIDSATAELTRLQTLQATAEITHSREYSIGCFPEQLGDELRELAH